MALNAFAKLVLRSEFGGKSTHYVKSCTMSLWASILLILKNWM